MTLPEYRPAFGFGLWGLATAADVALLDPNAGGGVLSLAGFCLALAWALGPRSLLGLEQGERS